MPKQPIASAPTDGSKVLVRWTSGDGVENESYATYRRDDGGWWVFTDSDTQKRVEPHSWISQGGAADEEDVDKDDG